MHFSGQAAVITPRLVTSGLGSRRVRAIAAAKHHTVIATEGGEVFTWGSNRGKSYEDFQPKVFAICKPLTCHNQRSANLVVFNHWVLARFDI